MFLNQITPTEVFQSFWEFIFARHSIYHKRLRGKLQLWTDNQRDADRPDWRWRR